MSRWSEQARRREHPEPEEGNRPVPKAVFVLIAGLFLWSVYYLVASTDYPLVGGDSRTAVTTVAAAGGGAAVSGEAVFNGNCAACHQASGQGIAGAFPPLAGSRWVEAEEHAIPVAVVLAGLGGEIEVQGKTYNSAMPGFGGQLSDAEVAAVVSYIRGAWGNTAGKVSEQNVAAVRERLGERGALQGAEELTAIFGSP